MDNGLGTEGMRSTLSRTMEEVSGIDLFLVLNAPHNIELIVCRLNILNVRSGDELVLTGGRE